MKLNRPWTGPWRIIKRLGEVAYRTKYEGSKSVGIKRRIVHHNQKEQFHEAPTRQNEAVVVVDGPSVVGPEEGEIQENNSVEQNEGNEIKERPQRKRNTPAWFVGYQMNF